ncbi:hypothetical protein MCEZLEM10_00828 [Methylophilaceae bacterium]
MNKFHHINLKITFTLLLVLLIIGAHNLLAGCKNMFDECYLYGSEDLSLAQLWLGILFNISLLVLMYKLFMDASIRIYFFIKEYKNYN